MAIATVLRQSKLQSDSARRDADGNTISNVLLLQSDGAEWKSISPCLEFVRLKHHQILHEAGGDIKSIYFLNGGLASVLAVQLDGKSVEVGLIGREGFVGVPVVFGFRTSAATIVTQCDAVAYRISTSSLPNLLLECSGFALSLQRYAMILGAQSAQLAACNRLHDVEQRLVRWLLMSHDRMGDVTMPLTQDFLAQMLGTRRSTVSMSAGTLQKAGMITYTRGNVTITDRQKLEELACGCYSVIQQQRRNWQAEIR